MLPLLSLSSLTSYSALGTLREEKVTRFWYAAIVLVIAAKHRLRPNCGTDPMTKEIATLDLLPTVSINVV